MHGRIGCRALLNRKRPYLIFKPTFLSFFLLISGLIQADPGEQYPIKHAQKPYMEFSEYKGTMQRDYRLLKEGMAGQLQNFKAHLNAVLHLKTPGYKRYKFVNYLHNDEDIIPIQYIDWSRERPVQSDRLLIFTLALGFIYFV